MDLDELVKNPQERLALELKAWIDPDTSQGKAKIIKACIAMRNNNSGSIRYWTDFSRQIFTNFASLFIRRF